MRKFLAYIMIGLCLATFTNHPQKRYFGSSKIFWSYMKSFEREYAEFGVNLQNTKIVLGMPFFDYNIMGFCHTDGTIELGIEQWKRLDQYGKELLVFHELGHCVLGLNHTQELLGTLNNKERGYCPSTIMFQGQEPFHSKCYQGFKQYYRDSLKILKLMKMKYEE